MRRFLYKAQLRISPNTVQALLHSMFYPGKEVYYMANRSTVICISKFKSGAGKPTQALLTKRWIEVINLSEKGKKNAPRPSQIK